MTVKRTVRIGCGAGFWGDSPEGPAQLVRRDRVDYLMLDYLAETAMSILARMKAKNPDLGYATDFVSLVMRPLAREIAEKRIKVITNAGGVNPGACRVALAALLGELGVRFNIAVVEGDDLSARAEAVRAEGVVEMFNAAPFPARAASVNAYLGAMPIAAALDAGADIVVTRRCVDSALALGPLVHEFGWCADDYDRLSAGSLADHVIECGVQATGGIVTNWREISEGWADMGYPVAECESDGAFVLTKPEGSGGLVSTATVAEQIVYEVGDPAAYLLPDVACDWTGVSLEQIGANRVRVTGARGAPPPATYKVSATYPDGFRTSTTLMVVGREAVEKAEAVGRAVIARSRRLLSAADLPDFAEVSTETLGAESTYSAAARTIDVREVVLKIAVRHALQEALKIVAREIFPAASSMAQGLTGFAGGRPEPQPVIRLFSFLIDKASVPVRVDIGGKTIALATVSAKAATLPQSTAPPHSQPLAVPTTPVPLAALAYGRSGDKGDTANIGVISRRPEFEPVVRAGLTAQAVQTSFAHYVQGRVERFAWPGLQGFNIVLHRALGGGGVSSLRHDPQGKGLAQALLDIEVPVPVSWLEAGGLLEGWAPNARRAERDAT